MDEHEAYKRNADALIAARTEQLRAAVTISQVLSEALQSVTKADTLEAAKRSAKEALEKRNTMIEAERARAEQEWKDRVGPERAVS